MPNDNTSDIKEVQKEEAKFFNSIAEIRTKDGHVPMEADIRSATKFIPKKDERLPLIDPVISKILDGGNIDKYLELVAHKPGGRVLDICCGSGWLSLELARRGQHVDAYDLSSDAISLAKQTLAKNPFKKGFGSINYNVGDVSEAKKGRMVLTALLVSVLVMILLNIVVGPFLWNNVLKSLVPGIRTARWYDTLALAVLAALIIPH